MANGNDGNFDPFETVDNLKAVGFQSKQAEALAKEFSLNAAKNAATKYDVELVRRDLEVTKLELKRDMKELETKLARDMKELELKIENTASRQINIAWGIMISGILLLITLAKFGAFVPLKNP